MSDNEEGMRTRQKETCLSERRREFWDTLSKQVDFSRVRLALTKWNAINGQSSPKTLNPIFAVWSRRPGQCLGPPILRHQSKCDTCNRRCTVRRVAAVVTRPAVKCQNQQKYQSLEPDATQRRPSSGRVCFCRDLCRSVAAESHPEKGYSVCFIFVTELFKYSEPSIDKIVKFKFFLSLKPSCRWIELAFGLEISSSNKRPLRCRWIYCGPLDLWAF